MSSGKLSTGALPPDLDNTVKELFYLICELQERLETLAAGVDPGPLPRDPKAPASPPPEPWPQDPTQRQDWFVRTQMDTFGLMKTKIKELNDQIPKSKASAAWLKHAMELAVKQFQTFEKEADQYIKSLALNPR
jgi:hypothetical protein